MVRTFFGRAAGGGLIEFSVVISVLLIALIVVLHEMGGDIGHDLAAALFAL